MCLVLIQKNARKYAEFVKISAKNMQHMVHNAYTYIYICRMYMHRVAQNKMLHR